MTKHAYTIQLVRGGALVAVVLLLQACSGMSKIDVQKLVTQGRDGWQLPDQVVEALQPAPGDVVADIGAIFCPGFRPQSDQVVRSTPWKSMRSL